MPGLRTRRLLALGAVVFSGVLLVHLFSTRNPLEIDLRLNDITSSSDHRPPSIKSHHEAQRPSIPEPVPDPESVLKQSQDRSSHNSMDLGNHRNPILPNEIPKPKTTLDPEVKYLGYLMYGGLTNQFIAFQSAAFVALRLNRTLILPPFITTNHDKQVDTQRWSDFFDPRPIHTPQWPSRLSSSTTSDPLSPEHVQIGKKQVRSHGRNNPWWSKLAETLTIHNIHTTERTFLRQFLLIPRYVRPPRARRAATAEEEEGFGGEYIEDEVGEGDSASDRAQSGTKAASSKDDNKKEDIFFLDEAVERQVVFLSHTYKLKDPHGPRSWKDIGQYMYFNDKVMDYVRRIVRHRAPEVITETEGKYIAMHLRRGDIWMKCRTKSAEQMMGCIPPLGYYAEMVDQARNTEGKRLPVLVTTDSEISRPWPGWAGKRLNHDLYTTEQELGIFGPAMVDAAILAEADFMIGTEPLYPRTTTSWAPED
ncbi:GDP-fucose protein O-fucosyltransferase-domain-containing protein [Linnemannia elongata]|nr:GDP-fucose protein O-fucosyltransferase-domain-containing protein [Linnemannia elongata]